jgi:hypothetical protein
MMTSPTALGAEYFRRFPSAGRHEEEDIEGLAFGESKGDGGFEYAGFVGDGEVRHA